VLKIYKTLYPEFYSEIAWKATFLAEEVDFGLDSSLDLGLKELARASYLDY